jgi:hypothetical protein
VEQDRAHRPFCHTTQNWRGKPLTSRLAVVALIGATTTKAGLKVDCALDERNYDKGKKVSDAAMAAHAITGDAFHLEWNYTIKPRTLAERVAVIFAGVLAPIRGRVHVRC